MGKIFSIDGGFFRFMTKVADFIIITFFTILCSLPLVTIGPALVALFYVALKLVKDEEGYIARSYFKAFKDNFVQSFLASLIMFGFAMLMYATMNISYGWAITEGGIFPRIIWFLQLGVCIVLIATTVYLFPLIARFSNNVVAQIKNSMLMAVKHIPQTVVMLVMDGLLLIYTLDYPVLWFMDVALIAFMNSYILARVFKLYMPKEPSEEEEEMIAEEVEAEGEAPAVRLTLEDIASAESVEREAVEEAYVDNE